MEKAEDLEIEKKSERALLYSILFSSKQQHTSTRSAIRMAALPLKLGALSLALLLVRSAWSFPMATRRVAGRSDRSVVLTMAKEDETEYRNAATSVLSSFMQKESKEDPLAAIDFGAPKLSRKLDLETLAAVLDAELYEKEWFVTGNVNPSYFSDDFVFQDPDVRLEGIEKYARGVNKLFNQETSRAEIISTKVNSQVPNTITCTWRLSGNVDIGPGLKIKPYIVYTDFKVDPESGLVTFQEDRFDLPQWDILLSSLFPFLIGKLTAPPAPPVEPRVVKMPNLKGSNSKSSSSNASPLDGLFQMFGKKQ